MKAAVVEKFNEIAIKEIEMPKLGYNEVLIKVEYSGICGTDIHVLTGGHKQVKPPIVPGHEFFGRVVEINSDKQVNFKVGDRVVAHNVIGCGVCEPCITGHNNVCTDLKILGVHTNGSFAEYIKASVEKVYSVPEEIDTDVVALIEPLAVAIHDVRRSDLKIGQSAFIIGGGPIGILIAMVAKLNGASQVVISEINENRIEFINNLDMGFVALNPLKCNIENEINNLTNGLGFDVVYEVSGVQAGAELMTKAAKIGGSIMLVGIPTKANVVDTGAITLKELHVKGVRVHEQVNFLGAIELVKKGTINDKLKKLVTNSFKLDDVKEAMEFALKDKNYFKILLET